MKVDFGEGSETIWRPDQRHPILTKDSTVLYPAFVVEYVPTETGRQQHRLKSFTCYYLFLGKQPSRLGIALDKGYSGGIQPEVNGEEHRKLLSDWWRAYRAKPVVFSEQYDDSSAVRDYLTAMLERRIGPLPLPEPTAPSRSDARGSAGGTHGGATTILPVLYVLRKLFFFIPEAPSLNLGANPGKQAGSRPGQVPGGPLRHGIGARGNA
jgi:hypothetical protein